jgi:hypothetical protein
MVPLLGEGIEAITGSGFCPPALDPAYKRIFRARS